MGEQMLPPVIGLPIGSLDNLVPRKRFILYQMYFLESFVPFKRFRQDKTAHQQRDALKHQQLMAKIRK